MHLKLEKFGIDYVISQLEHMASFYRNKANELNPGNFSVPYGTKLGSSLVDAKQSMLDIASNFDAVKEYLKSYVTDVDTLESSMSQKGSVGTLSSTVTGSFINKSSGALQNGFHFPSATLFEGVSDVVIDNPLTKESQQNLSSVNINSQLDSQMTSYQNFMERKDVKDLLKRYDLYKYSTAEVKSQKFNKEDINLMRQVNSQNLVISDVMKSAYINHHDELDAASLAVAFSFYTADKQVSNALQKYMSYSNDSKNPEKYLTLKEIEAITPVLEDTYQLQLNSQSKVLSEKMSRLNEYEKIEKEYQRAMNAYNETSVFHGDAKLLQYVEEKNGTYVLSKNFRDEYLKRQKEAAEISRQVQESEYALHSFKNDLLCKTKSFDQFQYKIKDVDIKLETTGKDGRLVAVYDGKVDPYTWMNSFKKRFGDRKDVQIQNMKDSKLLENACYIKDVAPSIEKRYYYALQNGKEDALKFISRQADSINNYAGQKMANERLKMLSKDPDVAKNIFNALGTTSFATVDGVTGYFRNIAHILDNSRVRDAEEYESMYFMAALGSLENKKKNGWVVQAENGEYVSTSSIVDMTSNYGALLDKDYQLFQTIGNQLPSILVGALTSGTGTALGVSSSVVQSAAQVSSLASMGLGVMGGEYHNSMIEGYSKSDALVHGISHALLETTSEKFLGGLPFMSDVSVFNLRTLAQSMAQEGTEEFIQTYLEAGLDYGLKQEKVDLSSLLEEAIQSGIYGALSAGILQGPSLATNAVNIASLHNQALYGNISISEAKSLLMEQYGINEAEAYQALGINENGELVKNGNIVKDFLAEYSLARIVEKNQIESLSKLIKNGDILYEEVMANDELSDRVKRNVVQELVSAQTNGLNMVNSKISDFINNLMDSEFVKELTAAPVAGIIPSNLSFLHDNQFISDKIDNIKNIFSKKSLSVDGNLKVTNPLTILSDKINQAYQNRNLDFYKKLQATNAYYNPTTVGELKQGIIDSIPSNLSNLEKARYAYLELAKKLSFDENLNAGEFDNYVKISQFYKNITDDTVLNDKTICVSWAKIYSDILNTLGIENKYQSANHAWVEMKIDDAYIRADATEDIYGVMDLARVQTGISPEGFYLINGYSTDVSSGRKSMRLYDIDGASNTFEKTMALVDRNIGLLNSDYSLDSLQDNSSSLSNRLLSLSDHQFRTLGFEEAKSLLLKFVKKLPKEEQNKVSGLDILKKQKNGKYDFINITSVLQEDGRVKYYALHDKMGLTEVSKQDINTLFAQGYEYRDADKAIANFTPNKIKGLSDYAINNILSMIGNNRQINDNQSEVLESSVKPLISDDDLQNIHLWDEEAQRELIKSRPDLIYYCSMAVKEKILVDIDSECWPYYLTNPNLTAQEYADMKGYMLGFGHYSLEDLSRYSLLFLDSRTDAQLLDCHGLCDDLSLNQGLLSEPRYFPLQDRLLSLLRKSRINSVGILSNPGADSFVEALAFNQPPRTYFSKEFLEHKFIEKYGQNKIEIFHDFFDLIIDSPTLFANFFVEDSSILERVETSKIVAFLEALSKNSEGEIDDAYTYNLFFDVIRDAYGESALQILRERPGLMLNDIDNLEVFRSEIVDNFSKGFVHDLLSYNFFDEAFTLTKIAKSPEDLKAFKFYYYRITKLLGENAVTMKMCLERYYQFQKILVQATNMDLSSEQLTLLDALCLWPSNLAHIEDISQLDSMSTMLYACLQKMKENNEVLDVNDIFDFNILNDAVLYSYDNPSEEFLETLTPDEQRFLKLLPKMNYITSQTFQEEYRRKNYSFMDYVNEGDMAKVFLYKYSILTKIREYEMKKFCESITGREQIEEAIKEGKYGVKRIIVDGVEIIDLGSMPVNFAVHYPGCNQSFISDFGLAHDFPLLFEQAGGTSTISASTDNKKADNGSYVYWDFSDTEIVALGRNISGGVGDAATSHKKKLIKSFANVTSPLRVIPKEDHELAFYRRYRNHERINKNPQFGGKLFPSAIYSCSITQDIIELSTKRFGVPIPIVGRNLLSSDEKIERITQMIKKMKTRRVFNQDVEFHSMPSTIDIQNLCKKLNLKNEFLTFSSSYDADTEEISILFDINPTLSRKNRAHIRQLAEKLGCQINNGHQGTFKLDVSDKDIDTIEKLVREKMQEYFDLLQPKYHLESKNRTR